MSPAPLDATPGTPGASDDPMPGPHFAGLLTDRRQHAEVGAAQAPTWVHESEAVADLGTDEDGEEGGDTEVVRINPRNRREKVAAKAIVAERLLEARTMNGYSQTEAATALGYTTPAQLSQIEQRRRPVPLHVLMRASTVYQVSLDFLAGLSDDPDRDVRAVRHNATVRAVRATLVSAVERVCAAMESREKAVGFNLSTVRQLVAAAEAVTATYSDFTQQRHAARAADRLAAAIEHMEGVALKAGIALRRHDDDAARMRERLAEIASNDAG